MWFTNTYMPNKYKWNLNPRRFFSFNFIKKKICCILWRGTWIRAFFQPKKPLKYQFYRLIRPWIQHPQWENTEHRSHAASNNRVNHLKNGTKILHNDTAQYAKDTTQKCNRFHAKISGSIGVFDHFVRSDVVVIHNSGQWIHCCGHGAQGRTKDTGNEHARHSADVTDDILHKIWHHFVVFLDSLKSILEFWLGCEGRQ